MRDSNTHDAQLLGYLVGGLEGEEERQVEAEVERSPEMRRRLEELRLALEPLAADKDEPAPPRGLAVRTIAAIAEHSCRPPSPAPVPVRHHVATSDRGWWRRADVLVAACLLVAFLSLAIPGLLRLRGSAARIECENNLHAYSVALQSYKATHGHFPNIAAEAPHQVAGMIVPILADAQVLPDNVSIRCPGKGHHLANSITLEAARAMSLEELQAGKLTACYAYSLGYKDEAGYHPPCQCDDQPANLVALMSDCPPSLAGPGNSPNHGGGGQNILFIDGSVRYHTTRNIGYEGDDIFTNKDKKVAAGLDCLDIVLGSSTSKP